MAKVIHINAKEQRVEIVDAKELEDLWALVGGYIEPVHYVKGLGHSQLVVDEEGGYKGYDYGFMLDEFQFSGNGAVGTLAKSDTKVNVADVEKRIRWLVRS